MGDCGYSLKFIIRGDAGVGKTSMLVRYIDDQFGDGYGLAVDFRDHTIELDGIVVKLQIWHQFTDHYRVTRPVNPYAWTQGVILVFDLTNQESFDNLRGWIQETDMFARDRVKTIVVGTKLDLEDQRVVDVAAAEDLADEMNAMYLEVSSKTSHNINEIFENLANGVIYQCRKMNEHVVRFPERQVEIFAETSHCMVQ